MMLAVIDPYVLHFDEAQGIAPLPYNALQDLELMLRKNCMGIPHVAPNPLQDRYWGWLVGTFVRKLAGRMSGDHRYKKLLDRLRDHLRPIPAARLQPVIKLHGAREMFGSLGAECVHCMRHILAHAVFVDETILITRLVKNRNAFGHWHQGRVAIVEKRPWELRVEQQGDVHRVACVCTSRNLALRWTTRYSEALPGPEDRAAFPFCPPDNWYERGCHAFRTAQSRPAWRDQRKHHWAEPAAQQATGTSEHWDVYLNPRTAEEYGLDQLNIVRWRPGAERDGNKAPGALHHVPTGKQGRLKKETGWSC